MRLYCFALASIGDLLISEKVRFHLNFNLRIYVVFFNNATFEHQFICKTFRLHLAASPSPAEASHPL